MTASLNPAAPHHLPAFITAPGETDVLTVAASVILVVAVLAVGLLFLRLHTLPERIAHRGHKLQFEIVAVLGLLALFTHVHLFWVIGLLLALIDIPDFGGALSRMARALERMAGIPHRDEAAEVSGETSAVVAPPEAPKPSSRPMPKIVPAGTGS
ncbi:multisubunit Na+/H+ antiporter MnhF subunit [Methylobacterium sp. BE186]|uniref:hypothetical protein n=1 Tax=Methylobacterium sp. BE186 TaxID=2817715 RepID=UPI0028550231|nr:hypothetical protein [Methylobacterium sp. BE186]MDR7039712.1 multisubunit Na+/H+ antiporter MnhF subunit [Methylobacterium sp. BE186]